MPDTTESTPTPTTSDPATGDLAKMVAAELRESITAGLRQSILAELRESITTAPAVTPAPDEERKAAGDAYRARLTQKGK